jgi:hypothetical protein
MNDNDQLEQAHAMSPMSPMRKTITLIFYLLMVGLGAWAAYEWLVLGGKGIALKAGCFLAAFGLYLVWVDFMSPSRERQ